MILDPRGSEDGLEIVSNAIVTTTGFKGLASPLPFAMARQANVESLAAADEAFVQTLRARVHADPGDVDALVALGIWLLYRERPQDALECFHRVTRKDPGYPGIWRLKAKAFQALGDTENAEICRRRGADKQS